MIKSSKVTLLFANKNKLEKLSLFIDEYKNVMNKFIDILWDKEKIPSLLPHDITSKITSWLSARAIQCAGKQASGVVRGTKLKQEKRLFQINKFIEMKMYKKARKLQNIYDTILISKPNLNEVNPELDSRFVDINVDNSTSFDGWLNLSSLGNKLHLEIPFKKHKHFKKFYEWKMLKGIRVNKNYATFMFEKDEPITKTTGNTVGIDIGQNSILSCSNGFVVNSDKDNHTLMSICKKLSKKKKGSKGFKRTENHRKNFINWSVNQLNLQNVQIVNIENIKHMRKGKRCSKTLSHWVYKDIFDKLESYFCDAGVQINKVNPTYTSQRCSSCGWTCKSNRKLKLFKCDKCCNRMDADLNASINLSLKLPVITKQQRLLHINKFGFYWYEVRQEPIVPVVLKT